MQNFKKLLLLLNPSERKSAALLLIIMLIVALLDTIGVASIMPFVAVISNPGYIETNVILNKMFRLSSNFGIDSNQKFFFLLGAIVFVLFIISLFFKALLSYAQNAFVHQSEYRIGERLIQGYLSQSYSWFLNRNSADLGKNILSEVAHIVSFGISNLLELFAKGVVIIGFLILLIVVDPKLSLIVFFFLLSCYWFSFNLVNKYLKKMGKERLDQNQLRFRSVIEIFGAIKEIKVSGLEKFYAKLFSNSAYFFSRVQTVSQTIAQLPRFVLEAISFGGVLLIMLYTIYDKGSLNSALPLFSLFIFAGYRLLPAMQQVYASLTQLTFVGPSLDKIYFDLKNIKLFNKNQNRGVLFLKKAIVLKNINYNYPKSSKKALDGINLTIGAKTIVGLVGPSGSGKTTIVDIILGLLETQNGILEIDGDIITQKNLKSWQNIVGYVPQNIYLADQTVAANIAFGQDAKDINLETVKKVCKIANLHNFIINELPQSYQTTIGERGVRLSGGQRQRIGIARALYRSPQLLILDEGTGALDYDNEKVILDTIYKLKKKVTVILITHRLNTIKNCDNIFFISRGKLISQGKFEELKKQHKFFDIK